MFPCVEFKHEPTDSYLEFALDGFLYGLGRLRLNPKASPGAPWDRYARSIKELFELPDLVREVRAEALRFLRLWRDVEVGDPLDYFLHQRGAVGLVMIKNEPHPERKFKIGAYRIIVKVPLCMQLAMRVIFGDWIDMLISDHNSTPLKPGMGLHDEGREDILRYVERIAQQSGGKVVLQDVSSWDWSLSHQALVQWDRVVIKARRASAAWSKMIHNSTKANCSMPFMCPSGEIYIWREPFGQRSGGLRTAESNSGANLILDHVVRGVDPTVTPAGAYMGDDSVGLALGDLDPPIVEQNWRSYGFKMSLLEVHDISDGFEFCSTYFGPKGAQLLSWARVLFRYLSRATLPGEWPQFLYELRGINGEVAPGVPLSEIVDFVEFLGRSGKPSGTKVPRDAQEEEWESCSKARTSTQSRPQSSSETSC